MFREVFELADEPRLLSHPELVIGIAGPIGIDIEAMSDEIARALRLVNYDSGIVRVTNLMIAHPAPDVVQNGPDYFSLMNFKMNYANKLCEEASDPEFLMRVAIEGIHCEREKLLAQRRSQAEAAADAAYIIRQLKRPNEVELLRRVYGKQFILISGYGSEAHRRERIIAKGKASLPLSTKLPEIEKKASALLLRDHDEGQSKHGQHLRDTFHLADVFVDGINRDRMRGGIERFFQAFFGRVDIGPTKIEYGMYAAKGASLRSTDLSRQVGSAAFTDDGELIAQGCNEVPKAFGGTYWHGEEPDYRDVRLGFDPNDSLKKDVIRDLMERLHKGGLLAVCDESTAASEKFVIELLGIGDRESPYHGCLKGSQIGDLTEYARVVHAEMVTICDAARLGRSVKGSTLFVTTFPCHNCTKHILASGIRRVFYLEPYPKSRAKELHSNEIEIEKASEGKVSFLPFLGISPYRYRDIFEKSSRKTNGLARTWYGYDDLPRPLVPESLPGYLEIEKVEVGQMAGSFQPKLDL
jgi:deoxycytidylate deaminase